MICSLQMDAVSINNSLNGKSTSIGDAPKSLCDADNGNTNTELNGGRSAPVAAASP